MTKEPNIINVLIVFPYTWIRYSPSVLNLIDCFIREGAKVHVVYPSLEIKKDKLGAAVTHRLYLNKKLYKYLNFFRVYNLFLLCKMYRKINKIKKNYEIKTIVSFDSKGYIVSYFNYKKSLYYSLEIDKKIVTRLIFRILNPKLITQNLIRKNLLSKKSLDFVCIPNSPMIYLASNKNEKSWNSKSTKYVYLGNLSVEHGVESCIESIRNMENTILELKTFTLGSAYESNLYQKNKDLLQCNKIVFNFKLYSQIKTLNYLQKNFHIGLSPMNMKSITCNKDNYLTSPSGKVFFYIAAGLPIIAINIPAFEFIEEMGIGSLIDEFTAQNLMSSTAYIKNNRVKIKQNIDNVKKEFNYLDNFQINKKFFGI